MVADTMSESTEVGNYFISNYPPFSFWKGDQLPLIKQAFDAPATSNVPLGLYMHIPFCRKRCKFCYFKVYTDVNAAAVQEYVDHLAKEVCMLADKPSFKVETFASSTLVAEPLRFCLPSSCRNWLIGCIRRSIGTKLRKSRSSVNPERCRKPR